MIDLRPEFDDELEPLQPSHLPCDLQVIKSCNDTWLIDADRHRFRRVPRKAPVSFLSEVGHWEHYDHIEVTDDGDDFTVVLNASGSLRLRSFRHTVPCPACGEGGPAKP